MQLIKNYGTHLGFNDSQFKEGGAKIISDEKELLNNSDIIIQLGLLKESQRSMMKENQTLIGTFKSCFLELQEHNRWIYFRPKQIWLDIKQ